MKKKCSFILGFLFLFLQCGKNNEPRDFYNSCAQISNTSLVLQTTMRQLGLSYQNKPEISSIHSSLQSLEFADKTLVKELEKFSEIEPNNAEEKELHDLFLQLGEKLKTVTKNKLYPLKNVSGTTPKDKIDTEMKDLEMEYGKCMDILDVINPKLDAFVKKHDIIAN